MQTKVSIASMVTIKCWNLIMQNKYREAIIGKSVRDRTATFMIFSPILSEECNH